MDHQNNIKAIPTAEEYESVVAKLTKIWDELLIFRIKTELDPAHKTGTMLDVGMGTGVILRYMAEDSDFDGYHFTGIDYYEDMVGIAEDRIAGEGLSDRITCAWGDASKLDYPDNSFDVVISRATIHHLSDPTEALREKFRVLKPGGFAIIHDARRDAPAETLAYFTKIRAELGLNPTNIDEKFTMNEMKGFIEKAGLNDVATLSTAPSGPESIGYELMIFKPAE
ncbi:class I SAM-dependent methyltransferase [Chitinophagaceae bacterium MMS25-I14]